jgi:hypothetical protein
MAKPTTVPAAKYFFSLKVILALPKLSKPYHNL